MIFGYDRVSDKQPTMQTQ